jgi:carbon-monoxide dehydrogenase medium subunit
MLTNIRTVLRPESVAEAVERLRESAGTLVPIAGGTATSLFKRRHIEGLIDLWSLPLRRIEVTTDELRLGATSTLADLERSAHAQQWAGGALWEAAAAAGSTPLRNLITVGGNLVGLYPWSDLPVALMVLDARITTAGPEATMPVETVIEGPPASVLPSGSLVTEITVPACAASCGSAYVTFAESRFAYAWASAAAAVDVENGVLTRCRVAIGAVEPRPRRLADVENAVTGAAASPELLDSIATMASQAVQPMADARASVDYRRHLTGVLCRRAVAAAVQRASKGS